MFLFSLQTILSLARELRRVADGDLMRRLFCGGSAIWQGMRSYATKNLGQKAHSPNYVSPALSDRPFRLSPCPARLRSPSDEVRVLGCDKTVCYLFRFKRAVPSMVAFDCESAISYDAKSYYLCDPLSKKQL